MVPLVLVQFTGLGEKLERKISSSVKSSGAPCIMSLNILFRTISHVQQAPKQGSRSHGCTHKKQTHKEPYSRGITIQKCCMNSSAHIERKNSNFCMEGKTITSW